ncbi:hypothetical protein ACIRSS_26045 [Amycolatopsis sp. NPDC101161]|uniref:hypothetical protein n=1 Tax=Amycolatopsis sp. NPDC101161 TaxID=3363940 RepID=UPI0037F7ABC0
MSEHEGRRIDRHAAERLLRGASAETSDALAGLLAAAAAPPRDGELGGEQAAVTAFLEAARHDRAPRPRSPSMSQRGLLKVAAAAAAVFAVGGVAAAATGALPLPGGGATSAPATSEAARPAGSAAASASTHAAARPESPASPSPSLAGLCHAYDAGGKAEHGKALESPAFTALIRAAGDRTKVDGYCAALVEQESPGRGHDTGPGNGKGHPAPTHPKGPHPAGRPAH